MIYDSYLYWETLASVVDGRSEHLIPDQFHVSWILAFHKPAQVFLHYVASRLTTDRNSHSDSSVLCFYLALDMVFYIGER